MTQFRIVWEDEVKAREVELFADYVLATDVVIVKAIRPTRVTVYDPETKKPVRTISVHTETGRELLVRQYLASRDGMSSLEKEILSQHRLREASLAAEPLSRPRSLFSGLQQPHRK